MFSAYHTRCGFHPESLPPTTPEENGRFLQTVVEKIATIRHDLGSVGDIIAAQVEEAMLGCQQLDLPQQRVSLAKEEAKADVLTGQRVRELAQKRLAERRKRPISTNWRCPAWKTSGSSFRMIPNGCGANWTTCAATWTMSRSTSSSATPYTRCAFSRWGCFTCCPKV